MTLPRAPHAPRSRTAIALVAVLGLLAAGGCVPLGALGLLSTVLGDGGGAAAPAGGPLSGAPSSVQNGAPADPGVLQALALSEVPVSETCRQLLPQKAPLPENSCALRMICLPGQAKPVEMRMCNYGPAAGKAPRQEGLPSSAPRPASWRWVTEKE